MDLKKERWLYLGLLALIWGSSFILMKKALISFSPIEVGALRIFFAALFLMAIGFNRIFLISRKYWYFLFLNTLLGSFFPAFLFAYAVNKIDSSIVSILNSLTPLNTLIFGALFFGFAFGKRQVIGIILGLVGTLTLILEGSALNPDQDYFYASFIIVASIGYALNVNIIKKYLYELDALSIAVANFIMLLIPTTIILFFTGFFETINFTESVNESLIFVAILGIVGTGLAKIIFNKLIHISNPVFTSSVTYFIPIVAISWGVLDGEIISFVQILSGVIIVLGVYLVNKTK